MLGHNSWATNILKSDQAPGKLCAHPGLLQIVGQCYSKEQEKYRYTVCPFLNVTQHELTKRWNSYNGVLGVWSHWSYADNFTKTHEGYYTGGDKCKHGEKTVPRVVILSHSCGVRTEVVSISEVVTCQYNISVTSPLFCHEILRDVGSGLEDKGEWERIEDELYNGVLTRKGAVEERKGVLVKEGCLAKDKEGEECGLKLEERDREVKELRDELEELKNVVRDSGLILPHQIGR